MTEGEEEVEDLEEEEEDFDAFSASYRDSNADEKRLLLSLHKTLNPSGHSFLPFVTVCSIATDALVCT